MDATLTARPLTDADRPALARLTAREPIRTLPVRLNLDAHGLQGPLVRSWGAFAKTGGDALHGLLIRFGNTMIGCDRDGQCAPAFAAVIDGETGLAGVRGTQELVGALQARVRRYYATHQEVSAYLRLLRPPVCPPDLLALVRRAGPDDLDSLAALYAEAGAMFRNRANVAAKLADSRVFVIEATGPAKGIAACALVNVEGDAAGLIGGVFTRLQARGRGYAAATTAAVARDLQNDAKTPYLFYENPVAGRVYHRLGFEKAGEWAVVFLGPR